MNGNGTVVDVSEVYTAEDVNYVSRIRSLYIDYIIAAVDSMEMQFESKVDFIQDYYEDMERCCDTGKRIRLENSYSRNCMHPEDEIKYGLSLGKALNDKKWAVIKEVENALKNGCHADLVVDVARKIGINPDFYTTDSSIPSRAFSVAEVASE